MARDPVCGMQLDTKQRAVLWASSQHAGATYHFCSSRCKKQFKSAPQHYAAAAALGSRRARLPPDRGDGEAPVVHRS